MYMLNRPLWIVVLSLLASAPALRAADSASAEQEKAPVTRSISELHVAVDPSTGRLIAPTPEQRAKLAAALARMIDQRTEGLEVRRGPNGMRLVDLNGRFHSVEVAVRGTDGAVHLRCFDTTDQLESFLERESVPSPAPRPATEDR